MSKRHIQPLDYAPRLRALDARRQARRDAWLDLATIAMILLLWWSIVMFGLAGVYFYQVEGLSQAWLPLGVAFGSLVLLVGAWCTSSRVRRVFRQEV